MKMESNIKKLDNLKNQIENSETNKLNLDKNKNIIELELKSFDNKSINLGRDSSQIEFDISQNKRVVEDLKQRKIKLNKDKSKQRAKLEERGGRSYLVYILGPRG